MTPRRLLVTGATGNVGREVLRALGGGGHDVTVGLRDPARWHGAEPAVALDLATGNGPDAAFDAIFLMRPPALADPAPFRRFLSTHARDTRIVFLSVAGAETKSYLPHAKIEAVIREAGFAHCFVRPGYFMENLTTTLADELARTGRVVLPAGKLGFDWISARDVGAMAAWAMTAGTVPEALRVTTGHAMDFAAALDAVNGAAGTGFRYAPKSVAGFVAHARRQGQPWSYIAVMLLLHTLPRLRPEAPRPGDVERILGRAPETLSDWAARNAEALRALMADAAPT
ncbi:MAG: SDR family oxidoreductase [Maritimibacter harenae]